MSGCALGLLEASAQMATSPHNEEKRKKDYYPTNVNKE